MDYSEKYYQEVEKILALVKANEKEKIGQSAELLSKSIISGNIAHIFGTGHSEMACKEVFTRAGSLSCIRIIGVHYELEKFERLEGMAEIILSDYEIRINEPVLIISSSGINALPIEVAMICKERGGIVIAITSLEHSKLVKPRHSSGKKLYEISDIIIDSHVPAGDAAVKIPGIEMKVGPVSSLAVLSIINSIVVETTALLIEQQKIPPIRISRNMPGGDENNQKFKDIYGTRIPELKL